MITLLAVFCGSGNGKEELYTQRAKRLGQTMTYHDITMIYEGGASSHDG